MVDVTLDKKTAYDLYVIAEACLKAQTLGNFSQDVIGRIQQILGQEMTACGVGEIDSAKIVSIDNVGFPSDFLASVIDTDECFQSPLFRRWLSEKTPQAIEFGGCRNNLSADDAGLYEDFQISNVLSHGMVDLDRRYATYFGFAQIQGRVEPHHLYLMSFMIPHLHVAYTRISHARRSSNLSATLGDHAPTSFGPAQSNLDNLPEVECKPNLSVRELEVLRWLLNGKSNWDIGKILSISEFTVKNHVQKILKKLNANSRQHAVAKALEAGIIQL